MIGHFLITFAVFRVQEKLQIHGVMVDAQSIVDHAMPNISTRKPNDICEQKPATAAAQWEYGWMPWLDRFDGGPDDIERTLCVTTLYVSRLAVVTAKFRESPARDLFPPLHC